MAYPAFPVLEGGPYGRLSPGSSKKFQPRVLKAPFGNGYSQRGADGVNSNPITFQAVFTNLEPGEGNLLEAFLNERAGYKPFTLRIPHDAAARQWTCDTWTRDFNDPLRETFNATLMENFDP